MVAGSPSIEASGHVFTSSTSRASAITSTVQAGSIIRDVVHRKTDVAIVWGPLAGYFARPYKNLLETRPVSPAFDPPGLPFTFAIAMGVRKSDAQLRDRLNAALERHRKDIEHILRSYGVPQLQEPTAVAQAGHK